MASTTPLSGAQQKIPFLLLAGLFLLIAGLATFWGTKTWFDSRDLVLFDKPVTLKKGHIKTSPFTTNLSGYYSIEFEEDENVPVFACPEYAVLKSKWAVIRDGRVVAHKEHNYYDSDSGNSEQGEASIDGTYLSGFDAQPGTYSLDVEILRDASCLNVRHPRLRVFLFDRRDIDDLNANLQLVSMFLVLAGCGALFAGSVSLIQQRHRARRASCLGLGHASVWGITGFRAVRRPAIDLRLKSLAINLPAVALACGLACLAGSYVVLLASLRRVSSGIAVSLPRKEIPMSASGSGPFAPILTIDAQGRVYVNYVETTWQRVPTELDTRLRTLPNRAVYFDADEDALFSDAAKAIDFIRQQGATPILVTHDPKPHSPVGINHAAR